MRTAKGFTLIELLVAVAIISVLLSVGLVSYSSFQKNARDTQRKRDLDQIKIALESYFQENLVYPVDSSGKIKCGATTFNWGERFVCGATPIVYMESLPEDPKSTSPYIYCYISPAPNSTFRLYASMENDKNENLTAAESCNSVNYKYKITN